MEKTRPAGEAGSILEPPRHPGEANSALETPALG
jgi:hypothetical protein